MEIEETDTKKLMDSIKIAEKQIKEGKIIEHKDFIFCVRTILKNRKITKKD
jgi:hypothetical protein